MTSPINAAPSPSAINTMTSKVSEPKALEAQKAIDSDGDESAAGVATVTGETSELGQSVTHSDEHVDVLA